MLVADLLSGTPKSASPWKPNWLPIVQVAGNAQMPVLSAVHVKPGVTGMQAFTKPAPTPLRSSMLLHGFVADERLRSLIRYPARYLHLAANYRAVVTPDLSMRPGMPLHERIHSAWLNRAVGAFFQDRGLPVIPNLRWAQLVDLDYVLDGLPESAAIAISCQTILREHQGREVFEKGMHIVLNTIRPSQVFCYGTMPERLARMITAWCELHTFPTDISRAHLGRVA